MYAWKLIYYNRKTYLTSYYTDYDLLYYVIYNKNN